MVSIEHFEQLAYSHQREPAIRLLLELLKGLEAHAGRLEQAVTTAHAGSTRANEFEERLVARVTTAVAALATAPDFSVSPQEFLALMLHHGWLGALFAASAHGNADHVLRSLSVGGGVTAELQIPAKNLPVFCVFYFAESEVRLDVEKLWAISPRLAAPLFLSLLAARFSGTSVAYNRQPTLLNWLSNHLAEVADLDYLPGEVLYRVYMQCSYADCPDKHAIKRPINELIRAKLRQRGFAGEVPRPAADPQGKPVALVVVDWFNYGHSIYRTHSLTIAGLRERFHVVGVGYPEAVDEAGRDAFDEFHPLSRAAGMWRSLEDIRDLSVARRAQILYMPSVGMSTLTVFASNLRVAPWTVVGLGHPATTHSLAVDLVAVEEDFVGDPACFSERLLLLPKDGQPYRRGQAFEPAPKRARAPGEPLQIAVVATSFKLNPRFLRACARIADEPGAPVHLHFFVGNASGIVAMSVRRLVEASLGARATFHRAQPYPDYMSALAQCDLFLNPFPFGNTNGIVDTVAAGLIGVCRTGPEVHEHIDEGLFGRLGLPDWLVTRTDDEYVAAACRLIDHEEERQRLSQQLAGAKAVEALFGGRAEVLGERLHDLWLNGVQRHAAK